MQDYISDITPFTKWHPVRDWFLENPAVVRASFSNTVIACDEVNRRINKSFVYVRDGISDIWLTPGQFRARGHGDCEDFSIYKMAELLEEGIPAQAMELVICFDKRSREYHCVLRVFERGQEYILDNQHVKLLNNSSFRERYDAIYAIGMAGWRICPR